MKTKLILSQSPFMFGVPPSGGPGRVNAELRPARRTHLPAAELAFLCLLAACCLAIPAHAGIVTSAADGGSPETLRGAIAAASPGDTITFDPSLNGQTITLTGGQLFIGKNLTIAGPGQAQLTISGNHVSRVFRVASGETAAIQDVTIRDGSSSEGGGIINSGTLTLSRCTVSGNLTSGNGGAIANLLSSSLTIFSCTMSDNTASANGGGISSHGTLTVSDSTLSGNSAGLDGGGIWWASGSSGGGQLLNCTVTGNSASGRGGGIASFTRLSILNCTVSGNSSGSTGGGIYNNRSLTVSYSTLSDNFALNGGGIYNGDFTISTVNIKNCIVANSPSGGDCANYLGTFNVAGVNFDTDGTGPNFTHVSSSDLNLGPLADNGGPTMTHALLPGSVALDAATDRTDFNGNLVGTDQRGVARWQGFEGDAGAYEMGTIRLTLNGASRLTTLCGVGFPDPGATAVDADGNPLAVTVTGTEDTRTPGTHTLTYAATDSTGHIARANRIVESGSIIVDVYSGFTPGSGGAPFDALVGSFVAESVNFATQYSYAWRPFGRATFGADIPGVLNVESDGTYTFALDSDDGSLLYIDGNLVVDNGGDHAPATVSSSIYLAAGRHCFEIEFYNSGGGSGVDLDLPPGVSYGCPVFDCPTDVSVANDAGQCGANVAFAPSALADPCFALTVSCSPAPGSFFPLGATPVTCQAISAAGVAVAQCSFNVIVTDGQRPTIVSCPADATLECPAAPAFGTPQFSDVCDNNLNVTSEDTALPTSGKEVSKTRRTWTARDRAGNTVSCSQTITVVDTTVPTIRCPADVTINTTGASGMTVNYPAATATDNCSTPTITCSKASGSVFNLGPTTVTATATDAKGNSAPCTFKVNVIYSWSGFLQPINADGSSVFKLGTTVEVKFQLTDGSAGITDAVAKFGYVKQGSTVSGAVNEVTSSAKPTPGDQFSYDPKTKQYYFNWGTKGLTSGTYVLQIKLGDGVSRTVKVGLK